MPPPRRTFGSDFKRFFLRGLAVLLPSVLTLWLLVYAYQFVDGVIASPINAWLRTALAWGATYIAPLREAFDPAPAVVAQEVAARARPGVAAPSAAAVAFELRQQAIDAWWAARWWTDVIGLLVAVVAVYLAGRLVGGFVGRTILGRFERLFGSLPVIRAVYPSVKQLVDFLFSTDKPIKFSRVVAVEYPRQGIWSIGLVTSEHVGQIVPDEPDAVTVFMPCSPAPFTGYTIAVRRSQIHELPMTVDQALRFIVSGGVLVPDGAGAAAPASMPLAVPVNGLGSVGAGSAPASSADRSGARGEPRDVRGPVESRADERIAARPRTGDASSPSQGLP